MPDSRPNQNDPNTHVGQGSATSVDDNWGTINNRNFFASLGTLKLRAGVPRLLVHYVPRDAVMKELANQLSTDNQTTVTGQAVASGDGGHGKTVLACAYAHKHKNTYPGGCYFAGCETESLMTALAALVLTQESDTKATDEDRARYAQALLSQEPRCLLILDNVRDAEQWNDPAFQHLLPTPPCHILVTTRAEHLHSTRGVQVGKLTEDEAFALLAKFRSSAEEPAHREAIRTILAEVEYLAAAVASVGAVMMLDEDDDWSAYAEHLKSAPLSELPDRSDAVRAETGYAGKTAQVLDDLRARLPAAEVRVLDYAALLPADKIVPLWLEMLLTADAEGGEEAHLDLGRKPSGKARTPADVIAHLKKLGLLTTAAEGGALLSVHRLHRRRAAEILEQQTKRQPDRAALLSALEEWLYVFVEQWKPAATISTGWHGVLALHALGEQFGRTGNTLARAAARHVVRKTISLLPTPPVAIQTQAIYVAQAVGKVRTQND